MARKNKAQLELEFNALPAANKAEIFAERAGKNAEELEVNTAGMARNLILAVALDGQSFGKLQIALKKALRWDYLDKKIQGKFNTCFSRCRKITENWVDLEQAVRDAFIAGTKAYATLANDIVQAEKAAMADTGPAADAPAPEGPRKVKAGTIAPKADDVAELASSANMTAAFEQMTKALNARPLASMDGNELNALSGLFDAIMAKRAELEEQIKKAA